VRVDSGGGDLRDSLRRVAADVVACRACPRLVEHRERVAREKRAAYRECAYWGRPVPAFGEARARLILVGLAPGAHGSNRTGRMFTGDASGETLFEALHRFGFASSPRSTARDDGLRLDDCFITAAVRCAPPGNKPDRAEFAACLPFLLRELAVLRRGRVYIALGRLAFDSLLAAFARQGWPLADPRPRFAHGATHAAAGGRRILLCSYHPSRQNTQTGRLTPAMFHRVFERAQRLLAHGG
jgi:uracil-DNA glycosylase family 4